ncbi:hypothetical protein [Paraburkholderia sp. 40]|uniref:hypothetical protein n=1 Tax=Paraburkholderia sp. 40 TaxID=2991059 RepID=UPI003D1B467F
MLAHRRQRGLQVAGIECVDDPRVLIGGTARTLRRIEQRLLQLGLRDELPDQSKQLGAARQLSQQSVKLAGQSHGFIDGARAQRLFLAAHVRAQALLGLSAQLAGVLGLIALPDAAPLLWVGIAGAGLGGVFSLTLVTAMDHSTDHRVAGQLVAFTQSIGFIVAAVAPLVAGIVRGWSGRFVAAWIMPAASPR